MYGMAAAEQKKKKVPERDGVPLTHELIRRKAEHNEGMLHNLEEIALHQLDIDKIECLNNCRCLKIVYLQCNLIRQIEGLGRLKELDYLLRAVTEYQQVIAFHEPAERARLHAKSNELAGATRKCREQLLRASEAQLWEELWVIPTMIPRWLPSAVKMFSARCCNKTMPVIIFILGAINTNESILGAW